MYFTLSVYVLGAILFALFHNWLLRQEADATEKSPGVQDYLRNGGPIYSIDTGGMVSELGRVRSRKAKILSHLRIWSTVLAIFALPGGIAFLLKHYNMGVAYCMVGFLSLFVVQFYIAGYRGYKNYT